MSLCFVRAGQITKIEERDILVATQSEYFKNYAARWEYGEAKSVMDLLAVARCIRPVLEGNLRVRYPHHFLANEWLGDYIEKVRDAKSGSPLEPLQQRLQDLTDINDYSKAFITNQW